MIAARAKFTRWLFLEKMLVAGFELGYPDTVGVGVTELSLDVSVETLVTTDGSLDSVDTEREVFDVTMVFRVVAGTKEVEGTSRVVKSVTTTMTVESAAMLKLSVVVVLKTVRMEMCLFS
jgi:hypothetical protein